jgi:predicted metalloprotease with PDZ domain
MMERVRSCSATASVSEYGRETQEPMKDFYQQQGTATLPGSLPEPRDTDYPGTLKVTADLTDVARRIFTVRQTIPVDSSGELTLLFPKWLPGYHSPQAPIELFAGLELRVGERRVSWRRDAVEVTAFHVDLPYGTTELEARFQFLSPTCQNQGDVVVGEALLFLNWNCVVLYPAGYFARRIKVEPSVILPEGWQWACVLDVEETRGNSVRFAPVALDVMVDSPLLAGRHFRTVELDAAGSVRLNLAGDTAESVAASEDQLRPHRQLVEQCDRLFGARHFDRYEFLVALTEDLAANGVEHHRSCETRTVPNYFSDWDKTFVRRDTLPHEYVHSWNGKHRRGVDSWTPSFDQPIRNSLMWVYEGLTQYWDRVLCARSGLWSTQIARDALAETAALQDVRKGSVWRPTSDTTRDPIIAHRAPLPWPSWQRSEDYYTEGSLIWLDVDTRIRELTDDSRSLDDFARAFFGGGDNGAWTTDTYTFEDVAHALHRIAPFDWRGFFDTKLNRPRTGAPLDGLERGGYRLVYRQEPSAYQKGKEAVFETINLLHSVGLSVAKKGDLLEVLWDSPAFDAKLTAGSAILQVNGDNFEAERLKAAVGAGGPLALTVATGKHRRDVVLHSPGHRYPQLEPIPGQRLRLDDILEPR